MNTLRFIVMAIFVILAVITAQPAVAQPAQSPTQPGLVPFTAETVIPNAAWCGVGDETREFAACAAARTNEFLNWAYNGGLQPPNYVYVSGSNIAVTQLGLDMRDMSPLACAYAAGVMENHFCGDTVHLGELGLQTFPGGYADTEVLTALVAAHESGHYTQTRAGGVNLTPIFQDARVFAFEQWSDCAAGVALWYWHSRGLYLTVSSYDAAEQFAAIGVEGEVSHGGPSQRRAAVLHGYNLAEHMGIRACGSPDTGLRL